MEIAVKNQEDIKIVELVGDVDASTAPELQQQILPLVEPNSKIILNMTQVSYMSSAGLRLLLSLYRQTAAQDGKLILVGLSEDLQDTMSVTGFLDFFTTGATLEAGLAVLK